MYCAEIMIIRKADQKCLERFKCVTGERGRGISFPYHVKKEVLQTIQEERNVLRTTKQRTANWIGDVLRRYWLLKYLLKE